MSDGSIERNSKGKFQNILRFGQHIHRKDRTYHFHDGMQPFVSAPTLIGPSTSKLKKDRSFSDASLVFTLSSPVFQKFADLFYVCYDPKIDKVWGYKVIQPKLAEYLNAEVLAFGFTGDGCEQKDTFGQLAFLKKVI